MLLLVSSSSRIGIGIRVTSMEGTALKRQQILAEGLTLYMSGGGQEWGIGIGKPWWRVAEVLECLTCDMDMSSKCRRAQLKQMKRKSSPGSESETEAGKSSCNLSPPHQRSTITTVSVSLPPCDVCWKMVIRKSVEIRQLDRQKLKIISIISVQHVLAENTHYQDLDFLSKESSAWGFSDHKFVT